MLLRKLFFTLGLFFVFSWVFFSFSENSNATSHCSTPPPTVDIEIIDPQFCEIVSGTKTIKVITSPLITRINIKLWADGVSGVCKVIANNLAPHKMDPTFNEYRKQWNSAGEIDFYKYFLQAEDASQTVGSSHIQPISTSNGTTGNLCGEPDPPPDSGDDDGESSDGGSSGGTSGGSQSQSSSSQTSTNQTSQTTEGDDGETEKKGGDVEEAVVEEEVPITIDAFDPDLFLKGGNVAIKDIKNTGENQDTFLEFSGTAKPNSLVTLYIFSNAVVAVVKSNDQGHWSFKRDRGLSPGKHTTFATIYDEGVTRRSEVKEFFVTKSGTRGSLILNTSNVERFYPYAAILGGTIVLAILILYLYRLFSKRKPVNL